MEIWSEWISADSERFAALIEGADLEVRVPPCPDWSLRELVHHLGQVQRFWANTVRTADVTSPWVGKIHPPADEDLVSWMRASTAELLSALAEADDASPCWTWWGEPATAGAVGRHQVQEAAVHRWDAELAVGDTTPIDSTAAADGVAEFIDTVWKAEGATMPGTLTLVASDTGGRWEIIGEGEASSIVEASSSELVLLLYGRLSLDQAASVKGDRAPLDLMFGDDET